MKFEKVDLFCPKCGKYSVYKNGGGSWGCSACLSTFSVDIWGAARWELNKETQEMFVDKDGKVWLEWEYEDEA